MYKKVIVILGGSVDPSFVKEVLDDAGKPFIIAADKGLEVLYKLSVMPDIILGDFDSVDNSILEEYKSEILTRFSPVKDFTDGEAAVDKAIEVVLSRGDQNESDIPESSVVILGATGSRLDHVLANISLLKKAVDAGVRAEIVDRNNKIRIFNNFDSIKVFKNNGKKYLSLMPLGDKVTGLTLSGFKYGATDADLYQGSSLAISNEITSDYGMISFKDGYLIVMETDD
ncbi:thiamine pyrophosphokinase [Eubacterium ruminantium]|uniref:Thiamine diphosphokinase n=1 Tax=Eubacterium ruminantium TaxID=42322 RepID=A0A1T4MM20_9FIRM|nr:thiamine diphosphokinase [Eubacterium ruminantium]SCW48819.1 thiamine pyrophosphokinase [Eubacterium ruminantium]SDM58545.1 thiamine diphosphokinase [Eubacterium ruminantium]SJZ67866.1 thiamine pyrophosphokinase [Eubacterium ruminantium]